MVLRVTKKLAGKLKIKDLQKSDIKVSAFEEWYGHLFIADRKQFILLTNAYSLYSTIIPGKGINDTKTLAEAANAFLIETLKSDGCESLINRFIIGELENIDVTATNNRGVLGSMNDMIFNLKFHLSDYTITMLESINRINTLPMGYLKYKLPVNVLKQMAIS